MNRPFWGTGFVAAALALAAFQPHGWGQAFRASIIGRITDRTEALVPGVHLRLVRIDTGESIETVSDETGSFSFAFLSPGGYRLTASAAGFRTLEQSAIDLDSAETRDLALGLEVGDTKDKVTVAADRETLETATASRTERLNPKRLRDLPLIGRQAYSLVSLTPGVIFTQEQFGSNGFAGLRGWDANGKFIINGGREGTNQFLMNGAPVSVTGKWLFSPSIDAIQEFKVMINTYDPQFGRTGGGTVVSAIKSGTNQWHGQLFEYFHNSVLDANTTQNNQAGAGKGRHSTNQFGATIGGPIRKDRDWIFASFEGFREIVPDPIVLDAPPVDLRNGLFSRYSLRVYDPLSARPCVAGVDTAKGVACLSSYIRTQFPRNLVPASRVSPIGQSILALYPATTVAGLTANYIASANDSRYRYNQPLAHWDHFFGEKDRLSVLAALENGTDFTANNGFTLEGRVANLSAIRLSQSYVAEWIHIFSASTVFDMRASFGRFTSYEPDSGVQSSVTMTSLGILDIPHPPATAATSVPPAFNFDTLSTLNPNTYSWSATSHWNVQPNLIHTRGRHVFHFGGEYEYITIGSAMSGKANGDFTFDRSWTQQWVNGRDKVSRNTGPLDGSSVADLLLGTPASGFVDYNDTFYRSWPYFGLYAQDTWKIRPKLALTLGLRYDVQVPLLERFNRLNAGFDLTARNPLSDQIIANWTALKKQYDATRPQYPYPAVPAAIYGGPNFAGPGNRRPYGTDWTDLQPRVGLAWSLLPRTVLRAGFGIFYRTADQLNQTIGFNRQTNYIASIDGIIPTAGLDGPYSLENPFPQGLNVPTGASLGLATGVGDAIVFDGRQRPIPRTYQYSIGLQRELPGSVVLDVNYSGSQTVHDSMAVELGAPPAADFARGTADPNYLNRQLPNPFLNVVPATSTLGQSIVLSAYDLARSYPLFNGVQMTTNPWARYRYDALQVFVERKVKDLGQAGEFLFLLSYTFSKSMQQANRLNSWNLAEKPVKELSPLDKPHTFALSGLWDLPFGWGRHYLSDVGRLGGFLWNGWAADWILTYNSGYPVSQPDAIFSCSGNGSPPQGPSAAHWFNNDPQCWSARPQYSLRTAPDVFSKIRNPSAPQLHLSIEKTWWLNDRFTMQLRGESFNLTNTPILPGPVTDYRDPRFGQLPIQQNNFPRMVQIGLKILF
jgi:hypothetical protein